VFGISHQLIHTAYLRFDYYQLAMTGRHPGGRPRPDLEPYREDITALWECGVPLADIVDTRLSGLPEVKQVYTLIHWLDIIRMKMEKNPRGLGVE
jgi:hypothetical protein